MKFNYKNGKTHGGIFHADEVFVTAAIRLLYDESFKVSRVFNMPDTVSEDTFVFDIGGGAYDHHQPGRNGERYNGIPYAAAGLFWRDFATDFVSEYVAEVIDDEIVSGIDAIDNGFDTGADIRVMSISNIISGFNPSYDEDIPADEAFETAVQFMMAILDRAIKNAQAKEAAKDTVIEAYKNVSTNGIIILPYFVPWQDHLLEIDTAEKVLYVVFPAARGGYNVQQVPKSAGSMEGRLPLPKAWAGLRDQELRDITGVDDAIFCHPGRFIAGAESLEGACELARKASLSPIY